MVAGVGVLEWLVVVATTSNGRIELLYAVHSLCGMHAVSFVLFIVILFVLLVYRVTKLVITCHYNPPLVTIIIIVVSRSWTNYFPVSIPIYHV